MSVFTTRRLIVAVAITLLSGTLIVSATKWVIDMSIVGIKTATTQQFAPLIGNLILSAKVAAENEIVFNLTFSGEEYITQPGFTWTIWLSNSVVGFETSLPEGLNLTAGALMANGSSPFPNDVLSLLIRARVTADGEWVVYGRFGATRGAGEYYGLSTSGIKISVANGSIEQVKEVT